MRRLRRIKRSSRVIPSKRVLEEFRLTYELKGAQKAVDFLARYYGIRRMKVIVDGRRIGNSDEACYVYDNRTAYFKKKGLHRSNVLHEFYHHLAYGNGWDIPKEGEEKKADWFAKKILRI